VLGTGTTGRLLAEHVESCSPARMLVVNRTLEGAEAVAREHRGSAVPLTELRQILAQVDIVATADHVAEPILDRAMIAAAVHERKGAPLALLDLGMPRNVAADVNELANVFVHDLEALKQVVDGNLTRRKKEVPAVEKLI